MVSACQLRLIEQTIFLSFTICMGTAVAQWLTL